MISRSLKNYSKDFFLCVLPTEILGFLASLLWWDKISCTFKNCKNVKQPFLLEIWSQFSKYQKGCECNLPWINCHFDWFKFSMSLSAQQDWLNVDEKKSDWAGKLVLFSLFQKWQVTCYIFLRRTIMSCDFPTLGQLQQLLENVNILPPTLMDTQSKLYSQRWQEKRSSLVTTQNHFL